MLQCAVARRWVCAVVRGNVVDLAPKVHQAFIEKLSLNGKIVFEFDVHYSIFITTLLSYYYLLLQTPKEVKKHIQAFEKQHIQASEKAPKETSLLGSEKGKKTHIQAPEKQRIQASEKALLGSKRDFTSGLRKR